MRAWLAVVVHLLVAAPLALSVPTGARAGGDAAVKGAADSEEHTDSDDRTYWQTRYRELKQRVEAARTEHERALAAYSKGKQRNRLRGEAKTDVMDRLARAKAELDEAERAWDAFPAEARSAGALPGWFRELEG